MSFHFFNVKVTLGLMVTTYRGYMEFCHSR